MFYKLIGIAINQYDDPALNTIANCTKDLNSIISILQSNYQIDDTLLLTGKEQTTKAFIFKELQEALVTASNGDNLIILYAGHGEYSPMLKTAYWQTSDSTLLEPSTWFDLDTLLKCMEASQAAHISLISDSCYSGAMLEHNYRGGGIPAIEKHISRELLASGGYERVSDGIKGEHSPFTYTLCNELKVNTKPELPFNDLASNVIQGFDPKRKQTPVYGPFLRAGHKGGSLILRKLTSPNITIPEPNTPPKYHDITLPLNLLLPYKINYSCTIPFFEENKQFNYQFINTYIQSITYDVINKVRRIFHEHGEPDDYIQKEAFDLLIGYTISAFNNDFLSLSIGVETYFGHKPDIKIFTANFSFNPEMKLTLADLLDYSSYPSYTEYLKNLILRFGADMEENGEISQKEILLNYVDYANPYTQEFTMNEETLTLEFINDLPSAVRPLSFLEIPISFLNFKIGKK